MNRKSESSENIFQTGARILNGKYRIEGPAGEGAFAWVYQATDFSTDRAVALKVLKRHVPGATDEDLERYRDRFSLEIKLGARLHSEYVIRVYTGEVVDDVTFLVMEFAAGKSLADRLEKGSLPVSDVVSIARNLCDGLTAIHEFGAVHRDLKPSNILFDADSTAKIGDLGLAQVPGMSEDRDNPSLAPPHPGTRAYMSPEQERDRGYLSPASDLFSLGCVLFEMLTGKPYKPVRGTRVKDHRPEVPTWLDAIVAKALQENAEQRFQSAQDVKTSLEKQHVVVAPRRPALTVDDTIPLELVKGKMIYTPQEFAEDAEQAWDRAVQYFWNGTITSWLKENVARFEKSFRLAPAEEWKQVLRTVETILARGKPNDPIESSAGLIEFFKSIEGYQPPALQVAPETIEFGDVSAGAGEKFDRFITLTNTGCGVLEGVLKSSTPALAVTPADFKCAPDESAQAQVSFAPDESFVEAHSDVALRVRTNVGHVELPVHYTLVPPEVEIGPLLLEFRDVEQAEPIVVRIVNKGPSLLKGKVNVTVPWLRVEHADQLLRCLPGEKTKLRVFILGAQVPQGGATESRALVLAALAGEHAIAAQAPLPPTLRVEPEFLDFGALDFTVDPVAPPSVTLKITNAGTGILRGSVKATELGLIIAPNDATFACVANQTHACRITLDLNVPWTNKPKRFTNGIVVKSDSSIATISGEYTIQGSRHISPGTADRVIEIARWGIGRVNQVLWSSDGAQLAVASTSGIHLYDGHSFQETSFFDTNVSVESVVFSPNDKVLASKSRDVTIKLWDVASGCELHVLRGDTSSMRSVAFSPDGITFASGSRDGTIKLWDVASGRERHVLSGDTSSVSSVVFSPDGITFASGSKDGTIKLWDVASGRELYTLGGHTNRAGIVIFSPDGKILASRWGEHITLWDVASGRELCTLGGRSGWPGSVAISSDGVTLASGSKDGTIKLLDIVSWRKLGNLPSLERWIRTSKAWNVVRGRELRTLNGHMGVVASVALSPDGKILASGSVDNSIKLWDVASGRELRTLSGHMSWVISVTFSPNGKILASGSADTTLKLWDVASGCELHTLRGFKNWAQTIAFAPDGKIVASGSGDTPTKLWDVASGSELQVLSGHRREIASVAFSPDGKTLASGSKDDTIKLWDVASGSELRTLRGDIASVWTVTFSPDGKTLASGTGEMISGVIEIWDVLSGRKLRTLWPMSLVICVSFSPDGKMLASGLANGTIKLWDAEAGRELRTLTGHANWVRSVAFSPDGRALASGSDDGFIKLWDAASGRELRMFRHTTSVWNVTFSPDGKMLASGLEDKVIKLWDVAGERELRTLAGHAGWVWSVAFSPDGRMLASGSEDDTIKLWDVAAGRELRTLTGHTDFVRSVAYSSDGKKLVSGSDDATVRVWAVR